MVLSGNKFTSVIYYPEGETWFAVGGTGKSYNMCKYVPINRTEQEVGAAVFTEGRGWGLCLQYPHCHTKPIQSRRFPKTFHLVWPSECWFEVQNSAQSGPVTQSELIQK